MRATGVDPHADFYLKKKKKSIAMYTLITEVAYLELNKILIYFTLINPLILKMFVETCLCFACGMLVWFKGGKM